MAAGTHPDGTAQVMTGMEDAANVSDAADVVVGPRHLVQMKAA